MIRFARRTAAAVALTAALGISACGDDESTTTPASSSTSTEETASSATATEASTVTAQESGGFADAAAALEADGFEVEDKTGSDLEQPVAAPEPVTAVAGATVTRSGSSGDLIVFEFADEKDAEAYRDYNDDDVLTTELVGTIAVTATANNTDLLDQAVSAIGG